MIKKVGLMLGTLAVTVTLALAPAVAASAATQSISGAVDQYSNNFYFMTAHKHSGSGPITITINSSSGCGGALYFSLRNGSSASATKVTKTRTVSQLGVAYTFQQVSNTSTSIPAGTYYITAAGTGTGCSAGYKFSGSLSI